MLNNRELNELDLEGKNGYYYSIIKEAIPFSNT